MKTLLVFSLILFLTSCEIEKLEPNDVVVENLPVWNTGTQTIAPEDIIIPCTLQPNLIRFNNTNYNVGTVNVNPPGYSFPSATYTVVIPLTISQELEMYFTEEPATGYYSSVLTLDDQTIGEEVIARVFTGSTYYTADAGANLYIQNYGDSIRISYCDIDFTNSWTIPNSKGQFVY
jgi:hypothetical protein